MSEVIVITEGQTEEAFVKKVLAPVFRPNGIFLKTQMLATSQKGKGGAVTFERLKLNVRNTLRQHPNAVLTTLLDLYGLDTDFPGFAEASKITDTYTRVEKLEAALKTEIVKHVGCRPDRFIPHIQPYEFEGLLFSDVAALCQVDPGWSKSTEKLEKVREDFDTPEHINNSYETKPSKRLENLLAPKYKKVLHGSRAAEKITLPVIENECRHFHEWMEKLRALA